MGKDRGSYTNYNPRRCAALFHSSKELPGRIIWIKEVYVKIIAYVLIIFCAVVLLSFFYMLGRMHGRDEVKVEVIDKFNKIDLSTPEGMKQLRSDWLGFND